MKKKAWFRYASISVKHVLVQYSSFDFFARVKFFIKLEFQFPVVLAVRFRVGRPLPPGEECLHQLSTRPEAPEMQGRHSHVLGLGEAGQWESVEQFSGKQNIFFLNLMYVKIESTNRYTNPCISVAT